MCQHDTSTRTREWLFTLPKVFYFTLLILVLVHFANFNQREDFYDKDLAASLEAAFTNYAQQPIQSIEFVSTAACSDGFEELPLGSWPGTAEGCQCPNTGLMNTTCTEQYSTCKSILPVLPFDYKTWKGFRICVKRTKTLRYTTLLNECTSSETSCGQGACVSVTETCPLTDLRIVPANYTTPEGYTEQTLTATSKLIFSNTSDNNFITNITVSLYDRPCLSPSDQPYNKNKQPFTLSRVPENGCGTVGKLENSIMIDSITVTSLFDENSITKTVDNIPGFLDYINGEKAFLVGVFKYTTKQKNAKCNNITGYGFTLMTHYDGIYHKSYRRYTLAVLILYCIGFFSVVGEILMRMKDDDNSNKALKGVAYLNIFYFFVLCIIMIIQGAISIRVKDNLDPYFEYLRGLESNHCFQQDEINHLVKTFVYSISTDFYVLWALNVTMLVISCVGMGLTMFLIFIELVMAKDKRDYEVTKPRGKGAKLREGLSGNTSAIEMLIQKSSISQN